MDTHNLALSQVADLVQKLFSHCDSSLCFASNVLAVVEWIVVLRDA